MTKTIRVAVAIAFAVVGLVACGGGDSDYTKADFVNDLKNEGGLTEEQATCVADGLESKGVDLQQLGKEVDRNAKPEDVLSEDDMKALTEVSTECASSTAKD